MGGENVSLIQKQVLDCMCVCVCGEGGRRDVVDEAVQRKNRPLMS